MSNWMIIWLSLSLHPITFSFLVSLLCFSGEWMSEQVSFSWYSAYERLISFFFSNVHNVFAIYDWIQCLFFSFPFFLLVYYAKFGGQFKILTKSIITFSDSRAWIHCCQACCQFNYWSRCQSCPCLWPSFWAVYGLFWYSSGSCLWTGKYWFIYFLYKKNMGSEEHMGSLEYRHTFTQTWINIVWHLGMWTASCKT